MLKILQARLQQYVNWELQDYKLDLEKTEEPEIKLQHPLDHRKSKRVPEKYLLLLYWLHQSFWLCGSQQTGKFWKRWEYQTTWPAFWETCMQVKKQQLEPDLEQQTSSKLGQEYVKTVYYHPAYLTSIRICHVKCQTGWLTGWIKISGRNVNNFRYSDDTTLMAES